GHLNKTVSAENNHSFSFYGKVMLLKTFGDDKKNTNWPMTSPPDPAETFTENGFAINAQYLKISNIIIHGDTLLISYQTKFSEILFSTSLHYCF
ncbi:hypothetical protein, partial [Bartonella quintana]